MCGVVKFYKPPAVSKGRDSYTVVHIIDESSPLTGLTCVIFNPSKEKLAVMGCIGAVVIIKGIRIESLGETGNLQAMGHEHTLVGVFSGDTSDVIPNQIGSWYELQGQEKERLAELKLWSRREGPLLLSTKLEEETSGHCFNMVCLVAAMAVLEERKDAVLSVVDGTTMKTACRELSLKTTKQQWEFDSAPNLFYVYRGLTRDVWVNNIDELDVAAGDVVHMMNVHSHHCSTNLALLPTTEPQVELRISEHMGSIVRLEDDSIEATKLRDSLPTVQCVVPSWRVPLDTEDVEGIVHTIVDNSTLIATLDQIKEAEVGSEYLAEVEVSLISPASLDTICVPYCPRCHGKGPDVQAEGINSCKCLVDGAILEYKVAFTFHLRDDTDELEVLVGSQESQQLFSKSFAIKFAANQETKDKLLDIFYSLTGGNDPFFPLPPDPRFSYTRPILNCAIKKLLNPSKSSSEPLYSYYLVNTVIDQR